MNFDLNKSIQLLSRTPLVLENMLKGLNEDWIKCNEGENTWSPYDIMGHLIHGEKSDWIPRLNIILSDDNANKNFQPFDRFAQFEESRGKSLEDLLKEFKTIREKNLEILNKLILSEDSLRKTGIHPAFGKVTLKQLLATWTVHDLGHISQITRVMAKQYAGEVGPWYEYLPILKDRKTP